MKESKASGTDQQMLAVYRHDAHKMRGQSHSSAPDEWLGIPVNQDVPYGADGDAAAMSRPSGEPEQVLHGHETHYRRVLFSGNTRYDEQDFSLQQYHSQLESLLSSDDASELHEKWLQSPTVAAFNESVYYPYTSLKYHTLLVGALVDCYRNNNEFDDLGLWLRYGDAPTPYRTVFQYRGDDYPQFKLDIAPHERPESAKLSSYPMQNFNSVWSRLPEHPWGNTNDNHLTLIDSQLRRIKAWSTALQYLEDALAGGEKLHA